MQRNNLLQTRWVIAIDGGGTKTAVAATELVGNVSPWPTAFDELPHTWTVAQTGSAHPSSWSEAQQSLTRAIELALDTIADRSSVEAIVLSLAGAGREADQSRVKQWLRASGKIDDRTRILVQGDIEPILDFSALFPSSLLSPKSSLNSQLEFLLPASTSTVPVSIAAIIGTGSIVAARSAQGVVRAGGWGPTLGDEGSGWAIGRAALQHVCRWVDSGMLESNSQPLVSSVIQHLLSPNLGDGPRLETVDDGCDELTKLPIPDRDRLSSLLIAAGSDRAQAAKLAIRVIDLAAQGRDPQATKIVATEMDALVNQIACVHARTVPEQAPWNLHLAGGLISKQTALRELLLDACSRRGLAPSEVHIIDPLVAVMQTAVRMSVAV